MVGRGLVAKGFGGCGCVYTVRISWAKVQVR